MPKTICCNCGAQMEERTGTYRTPCRKPTDKQRVVENATWRECENCGDQLLSAALCDRLDEIENG